MNRYSVSSPRERVVLWAATPQDAVARASRIFQLPAERFQAALHSDQTPPLLGHNSEAMTKKTSTKKKATTAKKKAAPKAGQKPTLGDQVEKLAKKAAAKPKKAVSADPATGAPDKKLSGLDAAAIILKQSKEPLSAKELVAKMADAGLWSSPAKTPDATIYAAMITEIKKKGDGARFQKVDRGRFTYQQPAA